MSLYETTKNNPIKIDIKKDAKDVVLELVSVMCDNKYTLRLKRNSSGEFKLHTCGQAYSNFQIRDHSKIDIEWLADDGDWNSVVNVVNSGTSKVYQIKQR